MPAPAPSPRRRSVRVPGAGDVARTVIGWRELAAAVPGAGGPEVLAARLGVSVEMVQSRLAHLHPSERAAVRTLADG